VIMAAPAGKKLFGLLVIWLLLAIGGGGALKADEIRPFAIEMSERAEGRWSLDWKQPLSRASAPELAVPSVPDNCTFAREPAHRLAGTALIGHADLLCKGSLEGKSVGLPQLVGNADALFRLVPLNGEVQSFRLTADQPMATIERAPDRWQVVRDYFVIGTEHILLGWDHLLFVIALVLLVRGAWSVVTAATAFTLAHSITLAAATLGYAGLQPSAVEALIAMSIVFLAVELLHEGRESWTRRWPWIVAFGFGLLHGFGFAGALREIGLPQGEVPMALLAFNLGVEAGQLLVIALVVALRAAIARFAPKAQRPAIRIAGYGIGITASYWMFDRLVG